MSEMAIEVENLSKRYRIGQRETYETLRDTLSRAIRSPFRILRSPNGSGAGENTIWALRDVSFEVKFGEAVGIIGRNGAGKSTLLKILSRITEPTTGRVVLKGRVGSLLEVGTGFNLELTGRENIFLNGAILGMRRREIERKFNEIVSFAEIDLFVDTPVKRYSSGMFMRLAFAVAAHLEPEILIVDEVLAVGDVEFQKKSMGKMSDVAKGGRTVLFVSHNMPAITSLCARAILLQGGLVAADGPSQAVVAQYLLGGRETMAEKTWQTPDAPGNEIVRLRAVRACTEAGEIQDTFDIHRPIGVEIEYDVIESGHILVPSLHFFTESGILAFVSLDQDPGWKRQSRPTGHFISTAWIPSNFLAEGQMFVGVGISTFKPKRIHLFEQNALAFHVMDKVDGTTARGDYAGQLPGIVRPLLQWKTQCKSKLSMP